MENEVNELKVKVAELTIQVDLLVGQVNLMSNHFGYPISETDLEKIKKGVIGETEK